MHSEQMEQGQSKRFKNIPITSLVVIIHLWRTHTHTNKHSYLLMDTLGTCAHFCTQSPTHKRQWGGVCFDKGIILLLTPPVPLKTRELSHTNTVQASEDKHTCPLSHTHTHKRYNDTRKPVVTKKFFEKRTGLCCHLDVSICVSVSGCLPREGFTCEVLLSH